MRPRTATTAPTRRFLPAVLVLALSVGSGCVGGPDVVPVAGADPRLAGLGDVAIDDRGRVLLLATDAGLVVELTSDGSLRTVAGSDRTCGDLQDLTLCRPTQLDAASDGALLIADSGSARVLRVGTDGQVTDLETGPLQNLFGLLDIDGTLWLTDRDAGIVRTTDPRAQVAVEGLDQPAGLAVDPRGVLHVADSGGRVLRIVGSRAETAVGAARPGETAAVDDATMPLGSPVDVAFDDDGVLWIADAGTGTVRRRGLAGPLELIDFEFSRPVGIAAHPDGSIYVADAGTERLLRIAPDGTTVEVIASAR